MSDNLENEKYYKQIGLKYKEDYVKRYLEIKKTEGFDDVGKLVEELRPKFLPTIPQDEIEAEDSYQKMNNKQKDIMWNLVLTWEIKGYIKRSKAKQNSPYFLKIEICDRKIKARPIFNLKQVNQLYPTRNAEQYFTKTLEELETIAAMGNTHVFILDITAAYNQIKMPKGVSIGFICNGIYFTFLVTPFGWSLSPLFFNAIIKVLIKNIKIKYPEMGLAAFYDDMIFTYNKKPTIMIAVGIIKKYFVINESKSGFQTGEFKYVGYFVNLVIGILYTKNKNNKIKPNDSLLTLQQEAKGKYIWVRPLVPTGAIQWVEILDQCKNKAELEAVLKDIFESIKDEKIYLPKRRQGIVVLTDANEDAYGFVVKSEDEKFIFARRCWTYKATVNTNEYNAIIKAAKYANAPDRNWVTRCKIKTDSQVAHARFNSTEGRIAVMGETFKGSKIPNNFKITTECEHNIRDKVHEADILLRPNKLQLEKYGYMKLTNHPLKDFKLTSTISPEQLKRKQEAFMNRGKKKQSKRKIKNKLKIEEINNNENVINKD